MLTSLVFSFSQCGHRFDASELGDTVAVGLDRSPFTGKWIMHPTRLNADSVLVVDSLLEVGVELLADGNAKSINLDQVSYSKWDVFDDSLLVLFGENTKGKNTLKLHDTVTIKNNKMCFPNGMTIWNHIVKTKSIVDTLAVDTLY